MFCPNCGKQISVKDGLFCPACGTRLPQRQKASPERDADPVQAENYDPLFPDESEQATRPSANERRAPAKKAKPKKKSKAGLLAACIGGGLLAVGLVLFLLVIRPMQQRVKAYNEAVDLLNSSEYAAAADRFNALDDYADAAQMADYASALEEMSKGNYKKAASMFSDLGDFLDAPDQLALAKGELLYADGAEAMKQGDYQTALDVFEQIPNIRDAGELARQCRNQLTYQEALSLYNAGSYGEALTLLKDVSGIPEADALRQQCENWITYLQAKEKYDAGSYAEALAQLEGIQGMPEAESLKQSCRDGITYTKALEKYNAGAYAEAADLFSQVPHVKDASTLLTECQKQLHFDKIRAALDREDWSAALALLNDTLGKDYPDRKTVLKLCQNHVKYDEAVKALSEGRNYAAYVAFTSLGDFQDAAEKAKSCIVSKPKNGELYHNSKYSRKDCDQVFVTPSDGIYTYVKIYAKKGSTEELVSCIFIHPGKTVKITLPAGDYIIKLAYGKGNWFGTEDMFGDDGSYQRAGGATYVFTRKADYEYTLKLRVGSGGNVGHSDVNRDGF